MVMQKNPTKLLETASFIHLLVRNEIMQMRYD